MTLIRPGNRIAIQKPKNRKRGYDLALGELVIGQISFPKAFGTLADACFLEEEYTFKRMGFWHPFICVRKNSDDTDLLHIPLSGKMTSLLALTGTKDGAIYELVRSGLCKPRWIWKKNHIPLIEYSLMHQIRKYAEISIIGNDDILPLLLLIGSYGLIMQSRDESALVASIPAFVG